MKIKAKLLLGMGLLFVMIVLLTALGSMYINKLSADTKNILVANYNTLDYSRQMLIALNEDGLTNTSIAKFETNLNRQRHNITEAGEKELTDELTSNFEKLKLQPGDTTLQSKIHNNLTDIMLLNMQAIEHKSSIAEKTADSAALWIAVTGVVCFLIAFTMLLNLPGNIANPIKELTASIKEIAAHNYSKRIHFEEHNEFGELANAFNSMAQKLEEYKNSSLDKLMMEKKRIETLINNINNPVVGLDAKKQVLFMNDVALKISGLKAEQTIGKPVQDIAVHNDLVRSLVQELFDENTAAKEKQEPVKIYADNKESYFEKQVIPINITPTGEKESLFIGNVILLQNITPFKELDFAKTNFIATVSHELKTPISSIKMSVQLLENEQIGNINDEQKNLLHSIKDDANRLLKITGELLNMTQVESGNIQITVKPSSVSDIVQHALLATKTAAEQKNITLQVNLPEPLPMVMADEEKTSWVLINLITNAIRYSYDDAAINISVKTNHHQVEFSVTDTGQGIAPQYKDKIFDRYFRVPGTQKEGTGLGLAISKEFIEAQGGTIKVNSDFGAGSTFTVVLNEA
ncbi:MAG: HAMP domain-containing protein [Bacteroidetes bacterium]|nr:HAMP domain-containing protein [Bacteroidota bacterium]